MSDRVRVDSPAELSSIRPVRGQRCCARPDETGERPAIRLFLGDGAAARALGRVSVHLRTAQK